MEFKFKGIVDLTMYHKIGDNKSKHVKTDFNLEVSKNLDKSKYLNNGLPTVAGTKALTSAFVQGLVGNIHQAHQNGYWDSAEHLRYIISELERGFIQVSHVSKGEFD